jgi:hypothetical protein
MKWLNRWFTRKILEAWENRHCLNSATSKEVLTSNTLIPGSSSDERFRF